MVSYGQIDWSKIKKMLKKCAPGHEIDEKKHHHWVRYGDHTFRAIPKPHKKKKNEVEIGIVKSLVSMLQIEECAKKHLPQLR